MSRPPSPRGPGTGSSCCWRPSTCRNSSSGQYLWAGTFHSELWSRETINTDPGVTRCLSPDQVTIGGAPGQQLSVEAGLLLRGPHMAVLVLPPEGLPGHPPSSPHGVFKMRICCFPMVTIKFVWNQFLKPKHSLSLCHICHLTLIPNKYKYYIAERKY